MQRNGLVKSIKFKNHVYVGDPINTVKIFSEKGADEIVLLNRSATTEGLDIGRIKEIASEAFMPMAYGGGVSTIEQIRELILGGVEKIILNSSAYVNPLLVTQGSKLVGSQSIVVAIDVKKNWRGQNKVVVNNGTTSTGLDPVQYAKEMEMLGAGEILLNSIDQDGTFNGYDVELIKAVSNQLAIPVIASGGAGTVQHFVTAIQNGASAVAAASMFVFQLPHRAVLISYPSEKDLKEKLFSQF